jgi:hypothetical protein
VGAALRILPVTSLHLTCSGCVEIPYRVGHRHGWMSSSIDDDRGFLALKLFDGPYPRPGQPILKLEDLSI